LVGSKRQRAFTSDSEQVAKRNLLDMLALVVAIATLVRSADANAAVAVDIVGIGVEFYFVR
jgi:hypothetical protein